MTKQEELQADLSYVKAAVHRSERKHSPRTIYLLWAVLILVGFPMTDFAPRIVGWYWSVAGPLGALASMWLGRREGIKQGQSDRAKGNRHALHWIGMMLCIFMIIPLGATGAIAWDSLNKIILLVLALGYFLAGVHLDRPLIWAGRLMAVGYGILFLVQAYVWTILGILISASLILSAVLSGRAHGSR